MEAAQLQAKGDAAVITERAKATAAGGGSLVMRVGRLDHWIFRIPYNYILYIGYQPNSQKLT